MATKYKKNFTGTQGYQKLQNVISGANSSGNNYSYTGTYPRQQSFQDLPGYQRLIGVLEEEERRRREEQEALTGWNSETPSYTQPEYLPTNQQTPSYTQNPLLLAAQNKVASANGYVTGSAEGDKQYQRYLQQMEQQIKGSLYQQNLNNPEAKAKEKEISDIQNQLMSLGKSGATDIGEYTRINNQLAEKQRELGTIRSGLASELPNFSAKQAYYDSMDDETLEAYRQRVLQDRATAEKKLADASTGGIDWMARDQYMNDIDNYTRELDLVHKMQDSRNWDSTYRDYMNLRNQSGFDGSYRSTYNDTGEHIDPRGSLNGVGDYIQSEMSKYGDITYDYLNNDPNAMQVMHTMNPYGFRTGDGALNSYYAWLNDDEKEVFNHLYKQSPEKAYEFMDFMQSELERRERVNNEDYMRALADKSPVGASMLSVSTALGSPIAVASDIASAVKTGDFNTNAWGNQFSYVPKAIRETVSNNIAANSPFGQAGSFLYNTGMSMADNMAQMFITGGMSQASILALMGNQVFANAVTDGVAEGKTTGEILTDAFIQSGIEVLTEKIGLDEVFEYMGGNRTFAQLMKAAGAEGSEEALADILNWGMDGVRQITTGRQSEMQEMYDAYRLQGFSESEALAKTVLDMAKQAGADALGGALSGFAMAGGGSLITDTTNGFQYRKLGKDIKASLPETSQYQRVGNRQLGEYFANMEQADTEETEAEPDEIMRQAAEELISPAESAETEEIVEEATNESPEEENVSKPQTELRNQQIMAPLRIYSEAQMAEESERNYIDKIAQDRFGTTGYEVYRSALQNNGVQSISERMETLGDFTKAYNAGMNNQAMPTNLRISEQSARAAYATGQNAVLNQYRNDNGKFKKGFTSYYGSEAGIAVDTDIVRKAVAEGRISQKDMDGFADLGVRLGTKIFLEETMPQNGWYERGGIAVALDADNGMRHVLSHEFVHRLQEAAPEEYETLKNYIADYIGSEDLEKSLSEYYNLGRSQGISISQRVAMDEVVADWVAGHMVSGDLEWTGFVERASQTKEGRTFLQKIRDFFRNIINKLKGSKNPDVIQLSDAMVKAQKLLDDTLNAAQRNVERGSQATVSESFKRVLESRGVYAGENSVAKYSLRSWNETDINALRSALQDAGYSLKEINKWIKDVNGIAATVLADRTRLDYEADEYQAALKPNAEYYYTLDLSTLCKKRLLYQGTYNAIMHRLVNKALMPEDTITLRRMMDDMGYEVPCGICYEESRKKNEGKFAERWLEGYEGWKGYRNQKHSDPYIPTLDQVTTTDGRAWLQKNHPEAYDSYIEYQKGRGSANPKVSFTHTDYRGDILRMTKTDIANVKHIGGLRIQSFSDFETVHVIDMMQAVMDMASKNLTAQAYTKVPAFADIFGGTGIKINLSLIGKAVNGKLVFDAKEGIDPKEAFRIRKKYSENVGTIIVGANDESILAAWVDPRIDMVIPFHRSGWSGAEFEKLGLKDYQDYTEQQTEVYIFDDGSTMSLDKASKKLGLKGDQKLEGIYSEDYWDYSKSGKENAEAYLRLCAEKHYRPVFYKFLTDNGDGTWSLPADGSADGYWKSLTDYKMYNNDGVGAKQQEVKPNFDMRAANKAMKEYDGNPNTLPVAQDVVDKFVKEYKAEGKKYSLRANDEEIERIKAKKRTNASDREILRDAGEKLSEEDFYKLYSAHVLDLRGKGNIGEQVESIKQNGFSGNAGFGVNVMPASIGRYVKGYTVDELKERGYSDAAIDRIRDNPRGTGGVWRGDRFYPNVNISEVEFGSRKGSTVLLVPEQYVERGEKVKNGFQPFDYEVVTVERDFQPYYELYSKAYDESKDIRYSLRANDAEYLELAKDPKKNEARLREMVAQAAKEAGFPVHLFHGTDAFGFTSVDLNATGADGYSFWASSKSTVSGTYTRNNTVRPIGEENEFSTEEYLDRAEKEIDDAVHRFRELIDTTFSEWYFGRSDDSYIKETVMNANPDPGFDFDGVYNVLDEMVYGAYDAYYEGDDGLDFDDWQEESEAAKEIYDVIVEIEGLRSKYNDIENGNIGGGIYELYANADNMYEVDGKNQNWNYLSLPNTVDRTWTMETDDNGEQRVQYSDNNGEFKDISYDEARELLGWSLFDKLETRWFENDYGEISTKWDTEKNKPGQPSKTRDLAKYARDNGYDGVIFRNIHDSGKYSSGHESSDVYAFFNPNAQVKSADPVTYDDNGNVIPLSERFNPENKDIRYSLRKDSSGKELSPAQAEYFKDSKVIDDDGNLMVMYHGTYRDFTEFDPNVKPINGRMLGDGFYFSPSKERAASWAKGGKTLKVYLNITNPYIVSDNEPVPQNILDEFDKSDLLKRDPVKYPGARQIWETAKESSAKFLTFAEDVFKGEKTQEILRRFGYDGIILRAKDNSNIYRMYGDQYVIFDSSQAKLTRNKKPTENNDIRYSLRESGYNIDGKSARWTDERIDSLIRDYGASNPNYSQAYAVLMNPRDYLKLTLSDNMLDRWNKGSNMPDHPETYSLDEERLRENTQTPFLSIYSNDGTEVQGHEGRHRMRALLEVGITSVPVVIRDTDTKYSKQTLESMTLTAQDFGEGPVNNGAEVTLTNLVPIKETNRDELRRLFGGNADVQFSLRGSRDIVAASERDSRIRNEYMEAASNWRSNMTALSDFGRSGFNTNMTALIHDYNKSIDKNTSERIVGEMRSLTREMVGNKNMTYSDIRSKADVIAAKVLWGTSDSKKFPEGSLLFNEDAARAIDDISNDIMAQILKSTTRGEGKYQALSKEFADYRKRANDKITEVRRKRDAKLEEIQIKKREAIARKIDSSERTTLLKRMNRLNKLMKTTSEANQEMIKDFIGEFNLVAKSMTAGKAENLADLSEYIDNMMRIDPDFMPTERTIKDVERLGKKNVANLTIEEVAQLNEALLNLENAIRTSKRLIDSEYKQHISELGNEIIDGVQNTKGIANNKIGVFNWFQQAYDKTIATPVIRPETEILRLVGFDRNNPLYKLTFGDEGSLASGQREMVRYKWQANKRYTDRFVNDKQFADSIMGKKARACEITGRRADGSMVTLKVAPDMLMALYMHTQNRQNFQHFGEWNDESGHTQHGGGITIPDFNLYRQGKIAEAYRVGTRDGNLITMTRSALNAAFNQLTEKEMAFIRSAQAYYSEMSQPEINRVSNLLLGYSIATEENYFRINTDSNYRGTNMDAIKYDGTLENAGWTKERIKGARNAILLIPLTEQFSRDIDAHAKYVGMAIPIRNFNKAFGVNRQTYDEAGDFTGTETSVQSAITGKWGSGATDYIQKLMSDIQNPRTTSESWAKIFGRLRGYYAGSVLALNAGVAIKQAASYPTAAAEIGWTPLIKAFGNTRLQGKIDMDVVNKYSPLMYLRTQGMGYQELADLKNLNKGWLNRALNSKALNWIQDMDVMTIKKLWKASEYYVRDNFKDLKVGTDEYYKKVGEVHSRVIERTQPNYTTLQRGEILRSDNDFIRMALGMFKTQPFQNFSVLFEATGELQAACRAYKVSPNAVTEAMRKAAVKKMARALTSQLVASLVFALMQAAWDWVRGRDDKYKDKEGKITFASAFKQIGINMGSNAFGMIPLGSVIYEVTETTIDTIVKNNGGEAIFNATAYGLDASTATGIVNDLVDAIGTLTKNATSVDLDSKNTTEQHIRGYVDILASVAQAFGYPADNFVKDGQAIAVNVFRALGATGQMTKYEQEFYAKRVFTAVSKDKKGYLEILYNAYDNDQDAYNKLYSIYIENDGFATSSKTSKEYIDDKMNSHIKEQTKNQNRDKAGLTESQLNDYQEALNLFDTDNSGTFTQEETYNALMSIALSQKQKETLWNERGWKKSFSEYGSKKK